MARASADTSHRPALDDLNSEQKELVDRLYGQFSTWWEAAEWSHDLVILSAGRIDRQFLRSLACLYGEKQIQKAVMADEQSSGGPYLRQQIVSQLVVPSCRAALRDVRFDATEYGENPPDAERSEHIAFRPAWEELRDKQREVMAEWWTGFGNLQEATEWAQDLSRAALGEESRQFVERATGGVELISEAAVTTTEYAQENPTLCKRVRAGTVSMMFLPWFCDAARKQVQRASEQTVEERPETPEFELGEDLSPGED